MSYGGPPQKTPYGDQDFIKEDWTPQSSSLPRISNQGTGVYMPPNVQAAPISQSPYAQVVPPIAGSPAGQLGAIPQFTEEDRLFLQSWRNESFYYRVVPFTAISTGALYLFKKQKGLPHKPLHYCLLTFPCYILGVMSYRGELRRRLESTHLNTPFIQGLRQLIGLQARSTSEFSGDIVQHSSDNPYDRNQFDSGNWGSEGNPAARHPTGLENSVYTRHAAYNQGMQYPSYNSEPSIAGSADPPKLASSYEELRARNRGMIQK